MWNDILTIIITCVSLLLDATLTVVIVCLYNRNRERIKNTKAEVNENIKVITLIKGEVKEEDLKPLLKNMSDMEKKILTMFYVQDMKLEAIAIELNLSVDYVKKVKSIAVSKLH